MYMELRITAAYGRRDWLVTNLIQEIGVNAIAPGQAVTRTIFKHGPNGVASKVIAAEQIRDAIFILYFLEGSDTITVHIAGRTIPEIKEQARRIERQLASLFEKPSVKTQITGVIYVTEALGWNVAIVSGQRVSSMQRYLDSFSERWLKRILTPLLIFGAAGVFLHGGSVHATALISLSAAALTLLLESAIFAFTTSEWKWREYKYDE